MLEGVHACLLDSVWDAVAPMIQGALDKGQGDFALNDVRGYIASRDMQLWVWREHGEIVACCVSQILNYPRRRVCQLPLIGGKAMRKWLTKETEEMFVAWARERGCSQLEGFCRDGWLKLLPHWFKAWTTMRRDI